MRNPLGTIDRRGLLKLLGSLPFGALLPGCAQASAANGGTGTGAAAAAPLRQSVYSAIGVRPLINARGTVTIVGATRLLPEAQQAMDAAIREYVQLDELMEGVGRRLAELTGAEWGCISAGASAALTMATAGCVTGGDPDKIWKLPDLTGMKDEVIITSYSRTAYDMAARAVGAKMVEVATPEELEAALSERTVAIMVVTGSASEDGPLSIRRIAAVASPRGVPIIADAAAEVLEVPNPHLEQGADLVVYSGGKALRGPQCSGLLLGRRDLVQASWLCSAPHHGLGRGMKVGREEVMGMLAAVEAWMTRDHEAEQRQWTSWLEHIAGRLAPIEGVTTEVRQPTGRSNRYPGLTIRWDPDRIPLTGYDVEQLLWEGSPRVAVGGAGSFLPFPPSFEPEIRVNSSQLEAGEERIIADRVYEILADPPRIPRPSGAPAVDLSGEWDLHLTFAAGQAQQQLTLRQTGNDLAGTHHGSFASRDLAGTLHGNELLFRSSHTLDGVRLNFEFRGTVSGPSAMGGEVSMGEYGMAAWQATRRA